MRESRSAQPPHVHDSRVFQLDRAQRWSAPLKVGAEMTIQTKSQKRKPKPQEPNDTNKPSGNAAVGRMNAALSKEYAEIKNLIKAVETKDVERRYALARRFADIRAGDGKKKYGTGAVKKLAAALGWSKSSINDYANVAEAWPDKRKFVALVKKTDKFGKPLSWSHFVEIAKADDKKQRAKLVEAALKHGWSVRELKAGGTQKAVASTKAPEQPVPSRPLALAATNLVTQFEAANQNTETFGQHLGKQLKEVEAYDLSDELLDQVKQARSNLEQMYKSAVSRLDQCVKALEGKRAADDKDSKPETSSATSTTGKGKSPTTASDK